MASRIDRFPLTVSQVLGRTGHLNDRSTGTTNGGSWPATEISVADYVAENLPFNFHQIKKSKRNG